MAGASGKPRAQSTRVQQANVAGGRPHSTLVRLSDEERTELVAAAAQQGVSVPRLMVESALGQQGDPQRAAAVAGLMDLDGEVRRIGANLNQLTRYSHQDRELAEGLAEALDVVVRVCLRLDATARWVMEKSPAVTAVSLGDDEPPPSEPDAGGDWASVIDPDA